MWQELAKADVILQWGMGTIMKHCLILWHPCEGQQTISASVAYEAVPLTPLGELLPLIPDPALQLLLSQEKVGKCSYSLKRKSKVDSLINIEDPTPYFSRFVLVGRLHSCKFSAGNFLILIGRHYPHSPVDGLACMG